MLCYNPLSSFLNHLWSYMRHPVPCNCHQSELKSSTLSLACTLPGNTGNNFKLCCLLACKDTCKADVQTNSKYIISYQKFSSPLTTIFYAEFSFICLQSKTQTYFPTIHKNSKASAFHLVYSEADLLPHSE